MRVPKIVILTPQGAKERVLDARGGETFLVNAISQSSAPIGEKTMVCHVRDYRYPDKFREDLKPFCIWSLGPSHYNVIEWIGE